MNSVHIINKKIPIIAAILLFCCFISFFMSACSTDSSNNVAPETETVKEDLIELESVDPIFESDEYVGKKVKVTGLVNFYEGGGGPLKMYGEYSEAELYLEGSENYDFPESECAIVIGVIKNDYDIPYMVVESFEECTDENCSHNGQFYDETTYGLTFSNKVDACIRYSNMNWNS